MPAAELLDYGFSGARFRYAGNEPVRYP